MEENKWSSISPGGTNPSDFEILLSVLNPNQRSA